MADVLAQSRSQSSEPLPFELPAVVPPHNEGHTVAAWFAMILIMVGTTIAAVGVCVATAWVIIAGLVVVLCGVVGGWLLRSAGHGQHH